MPSMMTWPDANGKFVMLVSNPPESMDATKAIAITEEPEGGSAWPTTTPPLGPAASAKNDRATQPDVN